MENKFILSVILHLFFFQVHSQNLSIQETINYINEKLIENAKFASYNIGYSVELTTDGKLVLNEKESMEKNTFGPSVVITKTSFYISDVLIKSNCYDNDEEIVGSNLSENIPSITKNKGTLRFFCKSNANCFRTNIVKSSNSNDHDYTANFILIFATEIDAQSLCNAFTHLFKLVLSDPKYRQVNSEDPFANSNLNTENKPISAKSVQMRRMPGGTYEVPVTLNDVLKIGFIFDSGASDVSVSPDIALTLIKTGTVKQSDFVGSQVYTFADGSTATSRRFIIRKLSIGNYIVTNVVASITNSINAPMLLGQSLLEKFGKIIIDNSNHTLRFE